MKKPKPKKRSGNPKGGPGRKPKVGPKRETVTFSLLPETLDRIDRYALINAIPSRSAAVAAMLAPYHPSDEAAKQAILSLKHKPPQTAPIQAASPSE